MRAAFAAGAIMIIAHTGLMPPRVADGGPTLLTQRGRGRGGRGGGGAPADTRSVVRGRVVSVDTASGHVVLDVAGTLLEATFARPRLNELKPGDAVFVTVDLIDTRLAAISGEVSAVDPQNGRLTVVTPHGPLTVTASPESIATLKPGDAVVLKLDVVDIGPPFEPSPPPTSGRPTSEERR